MASWSERVFQLRVARRLSQRALAELLGVSERSVIRWEKGYGAPKRLHQGVIEVLEREKVAPR